MKRIARLIWAALLFGACAEPVQDSQMLPEGANVRFSLCAAADEESTKSSVSGSVDSRVNNYSLMVYSSGRLVAGCYVDGAGETELLLVAGIPYDIYAVANAGEIERPALETELWDYRYRIDARGIVKQFSEDGIPMACVQKNVRFSRGENTSGLALERLVAKLHLSVDNSAITGMGVAAVWLKNCARTIQVFPGGKRSGSRITSAEDAMDGDYAAMKDQVLLSMGRSADFYVPENCQGTILPSNNDPWAKVPDNVSQSAMCTYLEVECNIMDGYAVAGDVTYRMFLGKDNCRNFDVCGNTESTLELTTSKDLRRLSWKILPDISFEEGVASATVTEAMHTAWNNQYIGEKSRVRLNLNPYLRDFLDDILQDCTLKCLDADGHELGGFAFSALEINGFSLECDMALSAYSASGAAVLWLCYPDGTPICRVDTAEPIAVKKPRAVMLAADSVGPGQNVLSGVMSKPMPEVGGKSDPVKVYLLDSGGKNLNSSVQYGFSLEPYSGTDIVFTPRGGDAAAQIAATVSICRRMGEECSDGPALVYDFSSENSGANSSLNKTLSTFSSGTTLYDCRLALPNASNALAFTGGVTVLRPILVSASSDSFSSGAIDLLNSNIGTNLLVYNPSNIYIAGEYCFLGGAYNISATPPSSLADPGVNFLIGCADGHTDTAPWFGRRVAFEVDPSVGSAVGEYSILTSQLFRQVDVRSRLMTAYGTQLNYKLYRVSTSFGMSSMQRLIPHGSKLADLLVRDASGSLMNYYYEDINGRYLDSGGRVQAGERTARWTSGYNYLGGVGWRSLYRDVPDFTSGLCSSYSPLNVDGLDSEKLRLSFRYDSASSTAYLDIAGNSGGNTIAVSVTPQFFGERIWTKANYGGNEYAYFTYNAPKISRTVTSATSSVALMTKTQMDNAFVYLNQNYWHESCGAVLNLPGNRYSALAMPTSMKFLIEISIADTDGRWVPYSSSVSNGPQLTISPTIYYRTALGTYVQNSGVLPDGTSVGEHETASKVASKYSDYFVYDESTRYNYTPTAEFVFPQRQVYYKVK